MLQCYSYFLCYDNKANYNKSFLSNFRGLYNTFSLSVEITPTSYLLIPNSYLLPPNYLYNRCNKKY